MTSAIRTRRPGFTLVELLVATALTMLIMTILAMSFQTAMDSLSHLRSAGELQDRLRIAGEKVKSDLRAPHFDDEAVSHGSVSNVRFDINPNTSPTSGFFRIDQVLPSVQENTLLATKPSEYSTAATTHAMMMTVRLPGTSRQTIFTAPHVGSGTGQQGLDATHDNLVRDTRTYGTRWAVVSWFLAPSLEFTKGTDPSLSRQPMFTLHRRVRLLAEVPNGHINPSDPNSIYYAHNPATGLVYTPRDVPKTYRPFDFTTVNGPIDMYEPAGDGSDIVLSNVLSFEVKAEYDGVFYIGTTPYRGAFSNSGGVNTVFPRPASAALAPADVANIANGFNFDFPYDDLPRHPTTPASPRAFDTGLIGGTGLGQNFRVKSLQIKLRVYDPKTMNTRQVTLVQEM